MTRTECAREPEMLQAVAEGRWPDGCDTELRAHVAVCALCADLAEVASLLSKECERTVRDVRVPCSGVVWWRAQVRIRQETLRGSRRTVAIAQAAMLVAGLTVALAVVAAMPMFPQDWLGSLSHVRDGIGLGAITRMIRSNTALILTLAALFALLPVATHFALTED